MRLYLTLLIILIWGTVHCQQASPVPGKISTPAAPGNPMDPNGDGWITSTGAAFTGPLDETEFELPYVPIPQYEAEPVADVQVSSTSCTMYDLSSDATNGAESTYYYYRDPDGIPDNGDDLVFFRFRVGRLHTNSVGFSILIDTDHKFGSEDPDSIPGNPGFEVEISFAYDDGDSIRIYDANGTSNPTIVNASYAVVEHLQSAYALNKDPVCDKNNPGFIDIYLPFSALGVSSTTQIRMAGASGESTGSMLGGNADDIAGVDGIVIPADDDQFIAIIGSYPPFTFATNQAPSCVDASVSVNENSGTGTLVHTVSASDPNEDPLNYSITSGNTGSAFAIDASGQITVNDASTLDFETTSSFTLTVRATDGTLFDDAVITINLNDLNETPAISGATVSLDENSANATAVYTVLASDPDGDALAYAITGGNTGTAFAINNAGQITVNNMSALDFESMPSFNLTVRVSDGTLFDDAIITVNLNDVNESPTAQDATVSLNENLSNGTVVHTVVTSDPEGDMLSYSMTIGTPFAINNAGEISVYDMGGLDYEATNSFVLTVIVFDEGGNSEDAVININLNDVNETPSVSDATVSLDENSADGTAVYTLVASDPDGDALTYTITAGNTATAFAVDASGQITVDNASALDFETTSSFTLTVRVSDGSLFDDVVITINLNDVNEPPVAADATVSVDENSANATAVHTVSASDPDDDALTYTITSGNTATAFAVDASGQITVNNTSALDFETTPSFTLTVRVSDGSLFDDVVITINLNDVNEPLVAADATVSLDENSANGTAVHTVSASDPDGDALTYTITAGNTASAFAVNASGQITVNNTSALDFETTPSFTLTVRVSDGSLFDDVVITINLNDVNEPPVAADATVSVDENSANATAVHTVSASDPDGDALTYTITAGNTATAFAVDASGQITVNNASALDFETTPSFTLTVRVSDGSLFDDAIITINVNDVNEPLVAADATVSLDENSANGTAVHTVSASDPDGDALTYAIIAGNTASAFAVNASGQIIVNNTSALDFETTPSFTLTVRVSDGSLFDDVVITINLNDVNEPPVAADATVSVDENSANATAVYTVSASDPDGDALTYTITGGNTATAFAVDASGQITVNNASALDFETTPSFTLTVRVSDGLLFDDAIITINVNDVDETPPDTNEAPTAGDATVSLDENLPNGAVVHAVSCSDPDGDGLTYSIIAGNSDNAFAISTDGVISVNNTSALDFEKTSSFSLTVEVSDGQLSDRAFITVNLQDVNESPIISDAVIRISEDAAVGTVVYTVIVDDPDANDVAVLSIEDGNIGTAFLMDAYTGEVIVNNLQPVDVPEIPVYELLIMVTDAGGLTATATLTIEIERLNEVTGINPLKGFSPDGDGINDFWLIKGIEAFPNNQVKVFNRWGNLVYEVKHYNNQDIAWRGDSIGRLGGPNGTETTYYYLITVEELEPITGYVVVK